MTKQESHRDVLAVGSDVKKSGCLPVCFSAGRLIAGTLVFLMALSSLIHAEDAPKFASRHGIKVTRSAWLPGSDRTVIVDIETPLISKKAVNGGVNRVYITLPENYSSSSKSAKRYPVLYLLHGGAGGNAGQWTTGGGIADRLTKGKDIITVMPDCGKVGWLTDWVDETDGAQHWETFHLTQLIPWIDANLRTNPRKNGRAIAGNSMGGYGALHYAFRKPDLFAFAASFSGAVNLQDTATQWTIWEESLRSGFSGSAAFGPKEYDNWSIHNPLKNVEKLRTVQLALYAGAGIHDFDMLERAMGNSTNKLHKALNAANIPNTFWMYGRPGGNTGCDGGHNFGCWNFALNDALIKMMSVLSSGKVIDVPAAADRSPDGLEVRDVRGPDLPADDSGADQVNVVWD